MSVISSNTLFHFTNSATNLIDIIKGGFKPRFCLEELGSDLFFQESHNDLEEAIPMTCFCDLPLSQIGSHLEFYGYYGIGLSKEWGMENGLTPITYIHTKSTQLLYLKKIGQQVLLKYIEGNEKIEPSENPIFSLMELSAFFKSYEGSMWRINKYVDKRFYDEREWRYVPFAGDGGFNQKHDYRLSKEEFLNEIKRAQANDSAGDRYNLKFDCKHIKYLIVKHEKEMTALSDALDAMSNLYNERQIKILKTKIISSEQINEDF
jgi:hypothetical protein